MIVIYIGLAIVVAFLFVLAWSRYECNTLKVKIYEIEQKNAPCDVTFAIVADYHNNHAIKEKLYNEINKAKPDAILIAGDMVVCTKVEADNNIRTAEFIVELSKLAPVMYAMGNHEMGMKRNKNEMNSNYIQYMDILDKAENVIYLDNENIEFTDYQIYGLNIDMSCYGRFKKPSYTTDRMVEQLGEVVEGKTNILLAHNPEYFKTYADWGADITISGHNHGGLMRLPLLGGVLSARVHPFPKYDYGLYEEADKKMLLSNGLGSHHPKIRFNNKPQLQLLKIKTI